MVGPNESNLTLIYGPADIEGHAGRDGRFYVVDTARGLTDAFVVPFIKSYVWSHPSFYSLSPVFPPEMPRRNITAVLIPVDATASIVPIDINVREWKEDLKNVLGPKMEEVFGLSDVRFFFFELLFRGYLHLSCSNWLITEGSYVRSCRRTQECSSFFANRINGSSWRCGLLVGNARIPSL
jgi:hypothetical protein